MGPVACAAGAGDVASDGGAVCAAATPERADNATASPKTCFIDSPEPWELAIASRDACQETVA
jgi:hypothetical protein